MKQQAVSFGAITLVALVLLSACAQPLRHSVDRQDAYPIQVRTETVSALIKTEGSDAVSSFDRARLKSFVRDFVARGDGVVIVTPGGLPGDVGARVRAEQVRDVLLVSGLRAGEVVIGEPAGPDDVVTVSYRGASATLPECDGWDRSAYNPSNLPIANFGCATQRNLGAMVANPSDLEHGQAMSAADSDRMTRVYDNYRQGLTTGSERSAQQEQGITTDE